jgi:hypothetical protein
METWLIADINNLSNYFGNGFRGQLLRDWPDLEQVDKATIIKALKSATSECRTHYEKGDVSFEILETTSPSEVEQRCPAAKRFLDRLRSHMSPP